jgi:predicted nucleic acid-binding protein
MKGNPAESPAKRPESDSAASSRAYVIDTSVAVKWYIPEAHSVEAKVYLGRGLDRHAPDYLLAEAASVVLKRVRSKDEKLRLTIDEGRMVLAALKTSPIQFHESGTLIDPAFALAAESGPFGHVAHGNLSR